MYARSITFHGRPSNIDAGISFVHNEVWPTLEQIDGCRGISLLVDRDTGHCIATTSWQSEETMAAAMAPTRPLRERGRDILGATMEIDEWEILMMHRTGHGTACRVTWMQGDLQEMSETVRMGVMPDLDDTPGFCGVSMLMNRDSGLGCLTTLWETPEAMAASRTTADELRARTATAASGTIVDVHEFELALAHLHVPEMA